MGTGENGRAPGQSIGSKAAAVINKPESQWAIPVNRRTPSVEEC